MLKLVKYEYRRNLTGILVLLSALCGLQVYYLIAAAAGSRDHVIASASLLMICAMVAVVGVLIYSVSLYSRELNSKTSYLTFMTPNSAAKILGAKLIATLILGVAFAALICGFAIWDNQILHQLFPQLRLFRFGLDELLQQLNWSFSSLVLTIAAAALQFLLLFFTTIVVAYLAITLSATALQNKRFKGLVAFVIFAAAITGVNWVGNQLPSGDDYQTAKDVLLGSIPQDLWFLMVMVASFLVSVHLLDKKVSL